MSKKKSMADWWAENRPYEIKDEAEGMTAETVEELYGKLGREPAVDASVEALRKEMAAVYRDMRSGRIDCNDGTRLAYVLDLIRKSHETHVTRERLGAIEKAMGLKSDSSPDWLGIPFDEGFK